MAQSAQKTIAKNDLAKSAIVVTSELQEVFEEAGVSPVAGRSGGLSVDEKVSVNVAGTGFRLEVSYYKSIRRGSGRTPEVRMWAPEFSSILKPGDVLQIRFVGEAIELVLPRFLSERSDTVAKLVTPFVTDLDTLAPLPIVPRPNVLRTVNGKLRASSFRDQITRLYDFRCAATGEVVSFERKTPLVAAHVRPVHQDGPDHVRNGILLNPIWHWSFDEGLWRISEANEIEVSRRPTGMLGTILREYEGKCLELPPGLVLAGC